MAQTKTITLNPTNSGSHKAVTVTVTFTERTQTSTDIANNQSIIDYSVQISKNAWATSFYSSHNGIRVTLTINGTQKIIPIPAYNYAYTWSSKITTPATATYNYGPSGTTTKSVSYSKSNSIIYANSTVTASVAAPPIGGRGSIATATLSPITVPHNADGTKTITLTAAITDDLKETYTTGSASSSTTMTLTPIARATQPSVNVSSAVTGSTVTISTPRANSSFTHTLKYTFGTITTETQIATGVATSHPWTIPASIVDAIRNSTSGTCTIHCYTYNGSTQIGDKKTTTFTITAASDIVPTMGAISNIEDSIYSNENFGVFLKNMSKLNPTIADGTMAYNSPITYSYNLKQGSNVVGAGSQLTKANLISAIQNLDLIYSGTNILSVWVVDGRGRSSTAQTYNITVINYNEPTITINKNGSGRCDSSGTLKPDEGTYFKIAGTYTKTDINNKNPSKLYIYYKESTQPDSDYVEAWKNTSIPSSSTTYQNPTTSGDGGIWGGGLIDTEKTYDIRILYKDEITNNPGIIYETTLAGAFILMDLNPSGYAIAFGKSSQTSTTTETLMEVAMPMKITSAIDIEDTSSFSIDSTRTLASLGLLDFIYPIGSLYLSVGATSPANLFGGTWELTAKGKTLLGADQDTPTPTYAANTSGGSLTHNHTYSHTHTVPGVSHNHGAGNAWGKWNHHDGYMYFKEKTNVTSYAPGGRAAISGQTFNSSNQTDALELAGNVNNATPGASTTNTQNNTTTSNGGSLPPYLAVYIWQRTA